MKRARRIAAVLALCLVGLVLALYLFRGTLVHPRVIERLRSEVAERFDARLEIERLDGNWFAGLRLEGVRWTSERPPLFALEASEVQLEWSLLGLAAGDPGWLHAVRATVERAELAAAKSGGGGQPAEAPASLPPLEVTVERVSYRVDAERSLEAGGVRARVERAERGQTFAVAAESVAWRDPAREVSTPFDATGTYAAGRVEIAGARIGTTASVREGVLDLTELDRGRIGWSAAGETLRGEVATNGALEGMELRADVVATGIELADLRDLLGGLPENVDARADLDASLVLAFGDELRAQIEVRSLEAVRGSDIVRLTELRAPLGAGGWQALARAAEGRVELDHGGDWHLLGPDDGPHLPPHHVQIAVQLDRGRAVLTGQVVTPGGVLRVERGEIALGPDPGTALEDAQLDLLLDADFDELRTLASMLGLDATGGLHGAIDLDGPLLAPTGRLTAVVTDLRAGPIELDSAELDVVSDGARVEIARCEFQAEPWHGSMTGSWSIDESEFEAITIALSGGAGRELVPGFAPERFEVAVEASGPIARLDGSFDASGEGVPLGPIGSARLVASGTFDGPEVTFERLVLEEGARTLRASGVGGPSEDGFELTLDALLLEGSAGSLELEGPARVALRGGALSVDELLLRSEVDGRIGRLEARADGLEVELLLDDFDPRSLLEIGLPEGWSVAGLNGTVQGRIDPAEPDVEVDLELNGFVPRPGAPSYELALRGRLTPDRRLRAVFEGSSDEVARLQLDVELPYDPASPTVLYQPGPVRIAVEAEDLRMEVLDQLLEAGTRVTGRGHVRADLEGTWEGLRGRLSLRAANVRAPEIDAALGEPVEIELEAELGDRTAIRSLVVRAGTDELVRMEGALELPFDPRAWASSREAVLDAPLELSADFALPLAGWVERAEGVRRLSGDLSGRTRVHGTLRRPLFTGDVRLRDGELRLTSAFPAIRGMNADIGLDGRTVRIVSLTGEVGAAPCELTGRIEVDDEGPQIDLALRGRNLLLARSMTLKVRADTDLTLRGPLEALRAEGEVVITEGRHAQDIDLLASLSPSGAPANPEGWRPSFWTVPPLADMELDVRVLSSSEFRLRGNLYDFSVRPELQVRGTGRVPIFEGRVYVDPSALSLPSGRLRVSSGVVEFRRNRPYSPELAITGEMRSRGFDISAQISGTVSEPEILLSSTPSLPNDELLVLFLTGQLPQGSVDERLQAAQSVGVYLAQDYFTRLLFGDTTADESAFDRIAFEVGADLSRSGAPTMKGILYLEPHRSRTGKTTYLVAERDKYDFLNYAFGIRFRFR